ncbi:unnamed protein product [Schistocephalus solidus]|uniref:TetR family transcriptional regulator n=1 Tax=Schistocephalus solidus TaxID=70667 RepID=A0A183SFH2_SCHSO|nr:unnamed protein product [Schistocephalus solidus]
MSIVCPTEGWCIDGDLHVDSFLVIVDLRCSYRTLSCSQHESGVMTESRRPEATVRAGQLSDAEVDAAVTDLVYVYYAHDLVP